jgi:toxin ParE1/3/4
VKIEWLPLARQDREEQLAYVAERNPSAAIDLGDALDAAIGNLSDYPQTGRAGRITGTRELVVGGAPYVVADRIERGGIVILRVLHGAQNWPASFRTE